MEEKLQPPAHNEKIANNAREQKNGYRSACLWFTGLSGSGKSTLATLVERELFAADINTYILDGDEIRKGLSKDLDFTDEGRTENIRRIGEVAKLMCNAGLVVMAAFISPSAKSRQTARNLIGDNFVEIFVDAPLKVCEQRDVKGMYKKARKGEISNFTGISSLFEVPPEPEIHIRTDQLCVEESVQIILNYIFPRLKL